MSNHKNTVLYIGVTRSLKRRVWQHKQRKIVGFTQKYNVNKLVYFEKYNNIQEAISREKQLKNWKRKWKEDLIKSINPEWKDLWDPGSSPG